MRFKRITEQRRHIKPTNKTLHIDIETCFRTTDYVNTHLYYFLAHEDSHNTYSDAKQ